MLEEIENAAKTDEYIIKMNKQVKGNEKNLKKTKSIAIFNMWRNFDVCTKSSNTTCLMKEKFWKNLIWVIWVYPEWNH